MINYKSLWLRFTEFCIALNIVLFMVAVYDATYWLAFVAVVSGAAMYVSRGLVR